MVDAIVRTLVRTSITRRHLLEWQTAAQVKADRDLDLLGLLPADGRQRRACCRRRSGGDPVDPGAAWIVAPFVVLWLAAPWIARQISLPGAISRTGGAVLAGRSHAASDRASHMAVLRDLRGHQRARDATRQLPGRPATARRPPHVADQHRRVPPLHRRRPRLRLDRNARDGRTARGDDRDDRSTRTIPRSPLQLVRHADPATVGARVRLHGRQRQPRRPSAGDVQRLSPDDRSAAARSVPPRPASATRWRSPGTPTAKPIAAGIRWSDTLEALDAPPANVRRVVGAPGAGVVGHEHDRRRPGCTRRRRADDVDRGRPRDGREPSSRPLVVGVGRVDADGASTELTLAEFADGHDSRRWRRSCVGCWLSPTRRSGWSRRWISGSCSTRCASCSRSGSASGRVRSTRATTTCLLRKRGSRVSSPSPRATSRPTTGSGSVAG